MPQVTVDVKRPVRHWLALPSLAPSLVHKRCITNSSCSSISARNTHLSSVKMSMYVIPCDCTGDSLSCRQPTLPCCHLHLCLCLTPDCQGFSFFWSEHCDFSEVSLFVVGGMRLVYSRWVICATTWSCCCWVGWQSMDSLWITLCVCAWAGHSLEGTYRLSFLCFCPSVGTWSNPTKEGIFFI